MCAFVFMWTVDMQDLCKTHLSTGVTSALYLSVTQKKPVFTATVLHSLKFDLFYNCH